MDLLGMLSSCLCPSSTHDRLSCTERRSTIYSDRPRMIMASKILSHDMTLAMLPYGPRFVLSNLFLRYDGRLTSLSGGEYFERQFTLGLDHRS